MKRSNIIPITRIYDIYFKYTYSEDVKKFMDEIVDIDRAIVYTKDDVLDKIRAEIEQMTPTYHNNDWSIMDLVPISEVLKLIDKYKKESEE